MSGLYHYKNFIDEKTQNEFINFINNQSWNTSIKRRTQHYGYEYNYKITDSKKLKKINDIPDIYKSIIQRIEKIIYKRFKKVYKFDQMIINEYTNGQGISKHIDNPRIFDKYVVTISLGSDCIINFVKDEEYIDLKVEPGDMLLLTDDSRYIFTHEIKPNNINNSDTPRISLTFRKIIN
jgi:alkylated DNA repair dioxygenase AlkB